MTRLSVWWDDVLVGTLEERRQAMRFTYAGPTSPMISVAMPPATRPYPDRATRPFFAGLLPEGEARRMIAYDLGLGSNGGTDLELLRELGAECAGALVIVPDGTVPARPTADIEGEPLTEGEIAQKLRDLPANPLGVTDEVRVSLPGVQPKLPLTRAPDGGWRLPAAGIPSTHILKPPSSVFPDSVPNEAFCMALADAAGLSAAGTEVATFDGIPTLVSERFDRVHGGDGAVERLHQEDACQALSIETSDPRAKYQRGSAGPSLAALAKVLDTWAGARSRAELLDDVLLTAVVGNADLHGKNVSLVHDRGDVRLAPLYDVMSTAGVVVLNGQAVSATLAMDIGTATSIDTVTLADVVDEARRWGLSPTVVTGRVDALLDRLPDAIDAALHRVPSVPASRVDAIRDRLRRFRASN